MMNRRFAATLASFLVATPAALAAPTTGPSDAAGWHPAAGPLMTRWAADVNPAAPLPEYPRPQLVRHDWQNLNGLWDYALTDKAAAAPPAAYDGKLLVPYPIQSALSGVGKPVSAEQRLFCHRTFTVPAAWAGRSVLLHFGAVDYEATVTVNGQPVGHHRGGYDAFTFDVTPALKPGTNDLLVDVYDGNIFDQPIGKQRDAKDARGIFYTGCTGIWQTAWLEPVAALAHMDALKIVPDVDGSALKLTVDAGEAKGTVSVTAGAEGRPVATAAGEAGAEVSVPIPSPHLWTPDDPYLYSLHVQLRAAGKVVDEVDGYFAMRKVSLARDARGRTRIMLNNQFVFQRGVLDQGYWPDGIYTAPTDAALRSDVDATKRLGFNMSRKHAKVEPDRWYYWCDQQGLLVWQDMPQAFAKQWEPAAAEQFKRELTRLVGGPVANHPSVIVWTTFNEGWGEHDVKDLVDLVHQLDPSRLVDNASGWNDVPGVGDIRDTHHYPPPACTEPEADRAVACGEFGGLGMRVPGHMWTDQSWGYQGLSSSAWHLTKQYQGLVRQAYGLRDEQGMSAYVYTQLTDVETESNGLLTYDRATVKPDAAVVAAANAGHMVPLPPDPHPDLMPTAGDGDAGEWHYTTTTPPGNDWTMPGYAEGGWMSGRGGFGRGIGAIGTPWTTDDIWLRRAVMMPKALPEQVDVVVFHDEDVAVYVNSVEAASAAGFTQGYVTLPMSAAARATLRPGEPAVVAVHCHQTTGGQYIDVGLTAHGKPR